MEDKDNGFESENYSDMYKPNSEEKSEDNNLYEIYNLNESKDSDINEEDNEQKEESENFSLIDKINEISNDDSINDLKDFLEIEKNPKMTILGKIEFLNNLNDNINKLRNNNTYEDTFIRCIIKDNEKTMFDNCDDIPLIKIEENKILFYDEKGRGKYFFVEEIIKLIFENNIFIKGCRNNEIKTNAYICKEHKEDYCSYCSSCLINICEKCIKDKHRNHNIYKEKNKFKLKKLQQKIQKVIYRFEKYYKIRYQKFLNIKDIYFNNNNDFEKNEENYNKKINCLLKSLTKSCFIYYILFYY